MIWAAALVAFVTAFALQGFFFAVWIKRDRATPEEHQTNKFLVQTKNVPGFSYFYSVVTPMVFAAWGVLLLFMAIWR